MKSKLITLDKVLGETEQLNIEDKEYLLDILSKRLIEEKRVEISRRVIEAEKVYKDGKVKKGKLDDLWKDLND